MFFLNIFQVQDLVGFSQIITLCPSHFLTHPCRNFMNVSKVTSKLHNFFPFPMLFLFSFIYTAEPKEFFQFLHGCYLSVFLVSLPASFLLFTGLCCSYSPLRSPRILTSVLLSTTHISRLYFSSRPSPLRPLQVVGM